MRKSGVAIAGILLFFGYAVADSRDSLPGILTETSLPAMKLSPIMSLDLYPVTTKAQPSPNYAAMNLNPRSAVWNAPTGRSPVKFSRFGDRLYDASLLSFVALNVADFLSTRECLKYPGLTEANPLLKPFVKDPYAFAAVKAGLGALSLWTMKSLYKKNKPLAWAMSIASNLALSYVVSNNLRLLNQAKARVA